MTEDDKELRELLQPRGHSWVTNGLGLDDEEEDMPVPIYGATFELPEGMSMRDISFYEEEGECIINSKALEKVRLL